MESIQNYQVLESSSIRQVAKKLDFGGIGFIAIINTNYEVIGIVTDGDFRRAILKGVSLNENVKKICNYSFIFVNQDYSEKQVINLFLQKKIERIPVLSNNKLVDVLLRETYYLEDKIVLPENNLDIPVVIMAGGKGTRMKPFTNIFPKPLIPIGEKTMLEIIMDEYQKFGFSKFCLTVNYKASLIEAYFNDLNHGYDLNYIKENRFLGTAGALKLISFNHNTPVFVSNCDILIKDNYLNILRFHQEGKYDLTLVAAMVHHRVPYGVCKLKSGGELDYLSEKPEYDYLVNSGMYIVNSSSLVLIPDNQFFHITELMERIIKEGGKVGVYPVSEKSWTDVGQWEEYNKVTARILN